MTHRKDHASDQLPPRPAAFTIESDIGRRRPRSLDKYGDPCTGKHLCTVEWTGELLSDGDIEEYVICAGTEFWSLWITDYCPSPGSRSRDVLLAHGPKNAASILQAAVYMLADYWLDVGDIYSTVERTGLLSEKQVKMVADLVWPRR